MSILSNDTDIMKIGDLYEVILPITPKITFMDAGSWTQIRDELSELPVGSTIGKVIQVIKRRMKAWWRIDAVHLDDCFFSNLPAINFWFCGRNEQWQSVCPYLNQLSIMFAMHNNTSYKPWHRKMTFYVIKDGRLMGEAQNGLGIKIG